MSQILGSTSVHSMYKVLLSGLDDCDNWPCLCRVVRSFRVVRFVVVVALALWIIAFFLVHRSPHHIYTDQCLGISLSAEKNAHHPILMWP